MKIWKDLEADMEASSRLLADLHPWEIWSSLCDHEWEVGLDLEAHSAVRGYKG